MCDQFVNGVVKSLNVRFSDNEDCLILTALSNFFNPSVNKVSKGGDIDVVNKYLATVVVEGSRDNCHVSSTLPMPDMTMAINRLPPLEIWLILHFGTRMCTWSSWEVTRGHCFYCWVWTWGSVSRTLSTHASETLYQSRPLTTWWGFPLMILVWLTLILGQPFRNRNPWKPVEYWSNPTVMLSFPLLFLHSLSYWSA